VAWTHNTGSRHIAYAAPALKPPHPVAFDVAYPERLSRVKIFFKLLLAIPQAIAILLLSVALSVLSFLAWFAILFTGRYPKAFFEFTSGVVRWKANVGAYVLLLRDEYPPFSWEPGEYPLSLEIPRAERQSRVRLFIRLFAIIPNQIVLTFVEIALAFTTFISWWAILITGKYPRGLFRFSVGTGRWYFRSQAYQYLLRDEYPPYSVNADARPGNEAVSAVIGLPLFAARIALTVLPLFGVLGGSTTVHASLSPAAIQRAHPNGASGSLRITLLDYSDNADASADALPGTGYKFVSFHMLAEKDGFFPAFFWPVFLSVKTCAGYSHGIDVQASGIRLRVFWRGGSTQTTAYFEIPPNTSVCELSYLGSRIRFVFR
jgi:hypothetical protein